MWLIRTVPMTKAIKLIIQGRVQGGVSSLVSAAGVSIAAKRLCAKFSYR